VLETFMLREYFHETPGVIIGTYIRLTYRGISGQVRVFDLDISVNLTKKYLETIVKEITNRGHDPIKIVPVAKPEEGKPKFMVRAIEVPF